MQRVLGLDIGTSSVGWAVLEVPDAESEVGSVLAMGSRIFSAGAEQSGATLTTRARDRRARRSMRRQIARRARRRQALRRELAGIGLLPTDEGEFTRLMDLDPNVLLVRAQAGEELSLREIGRVVYWMSCRRGFLSLRSGGSVVVDESDRDGFAPERFRVSQFSAQTGERLHVGQEDVFIDFVRSQASHYPELFTERVLFGRRGRLEYPIRPIPRRSYQASDGGLIDEFGLHGVLFFQRKVYWRDSTIGVCSLDPKSGRQRAARAERLSQEFSVWQTVVNLRVGTDERALTAAQRQALFTRLNGQKTLAFSQVRKILALGPDEPINFERPDTTSLRGNQTEPELAKKLGRAWAEMPERDRDQLVFLLLGTSTEDQVRVQLARRFGLDDAQVQAALSVSLPPGRMAYSRRTIRRLLDYLPESESLRDAISAAGYETPEAVRASEPVDLQKVTNPLVRASLCQVDKLLRALESRFERPGFPAFDVVRIELARDVSNSAKQRERMTRQQRQNERERDRARTLINEFAAGAETSGENIRKARLWADQNECCLYCGMPISPIDLFTNRVEVDHILPRAQTLDNSMGNVVLVHADENQAKGDRTPTEWLGPEKADEIVMRARDWKLPPVKLRNLRTAHVDISAIPASLLTQTGYATTLARRLAGERPGLCQRVEVTRGRLTAALRYHIGVAKDPDDHRRHALDAAMVALTTPSIAQNLARRYKHERDRGLRRNENYGAWEPWPGLRTQLTDAYEQIVVSHRVRRKVRGPLHEETLYGKVQSPHQPDRTDLYGRRRPVSEIKTPKRLAEVADPAVRQALVDDLRGRGIDPDAPGSFSFDPAVPPRMPDGAAILRVRCHLNLPSNRVLRPDTDPKTGVTLAGNHVAFVYENTDTGKWRLHVVARFDAFRVRNLSETEQRARFAKPGERCLFTLHAGDILALDEDDLYRCIALDGESNRLSVKELDDSAPTPGVRLSVGGANGLQARNARKVSVTIDGQVRRATD